MKSILFSIACWMVFSTLSAQTNSLVHDCSYGDVPACLELAELSEIYINKCEQSLDEAEARCNQVTSSVDQTICTMELASQQETLNKKRLMINDVNRQINRVINKCGDSDSRGCRRSCQAFLTVVEASQVVLKDFWEYVGFQQTKD